MLCSLQFYSKIIKPFHISNLLISDFIESKKCIPIRFQGFPRRLMNDHEFPLEQCQVNGSFQQQTSRPLFPSKRTWESIHRKASISPFEIFYQRDRQRCLHTREFYARLRPCYQCNDWNRPVCLVHWVPSDPKNIFEPRRTTKIDWPHLQNKFYPFQVFGSKNKVII